ncbi:hypothetical protein NDU88_004795 [Pleurodeles waltl]|uniref:Uncharacterized protein n=1 Tax=Pleurodeles waltl TaxID=8319 RepID=A0AAV7N421_PLEWA|nr:hypothetical protein NDU88_004795 [Pleurodeles waltl]
MYLRRLSLQASPGPGFVVTIVWCLQGAPRAALSLCFTCFWLRGRLCLVPKRCTSGGSLFRLHLVRASWSPLSGACRMQLGRLSLWASPGPAFVVAFVWCLKVYLRRLSLQASPGPGFVIPFVCACRVYLRWLSLWASPGPGFMVAFVWCLRVYLWRFSLQASPGPGFVVFFVWCLQGAPWAVLSSGFTWSWLCGRLCLVPKRCISGSSLFGLHLVRASWSPLSGACRVHLGQLSLFGLHLVLASWSPLSGAKKVHFRRLSLRASPGPGFVVTFVWCLQGAPRAALSLGFTWSILRGYLCLVPEGVPRAALSSGLTWSGLCDPLCLVPAGCTSGISLYGLHLVEASWSPLSGA